MRIVGKGSTAASDPEARATRAGAPACSARPSASTFATAHAIAFLSVSVSIWPHTPKRAIVASRMLRKSRILISSIFDAPLRFHQTTSRNTDCAPVASALIWRSPVSTICS